MGLTAVSCGWATNAAKAAGRYATPNADIHAVYAQQHRASVRVRALVDFVAASFVGSEAA
jgi:hypothetical protein